MNEIFTPARLVTTLQGGDKHPGNTTEIYLARYEHIITKLLHESGFSDLEFHSLDKLRGTLANADVAPDISGYRNGRRAVICFAPPAPDMMAVTHLSAGQCAYCDTNHAGEDIYYAQLFYSWNDDDSHSLMLLGPAPVKADGTWINDNLSKSQFLPLSMRDGMDRYSSIYNGGVLFKIYQAIFPLLSDRGNIPKFGIRHLFEHSPQGETGYIALHLFPLPTVMMLIQRGTDDEPAAYTRSFFLHCDGPKSDLELVKISETSAPEDGLISLMDSNGFTFLAECLEIVLFRGRIPTSCRYLWTCYMAAETFRPVERSITITSGPAFEMHKDEYRREHGCEPPHDFALNLSLSHTRFIMQSSDDSYSSIMGQVISVEPAEVDDQPMSLVCIHPLPDNEDVVLQVFVSPEIMGDYTPAVGETIQCTGYLYVSPDEMLQDVPGWQDSVEVGEILSEHDADIEAHRVYDVVAPVSMGHAVAAAAFVRAGWHMEPIHPDSFFSPWSALKFTGQVGEKAVAYIQTCINGHEPTESYVDIEELTKLAHEVFGNDTQCFICKVKLDYKPAADRYAVSMSIEPECPGIKNTLIYCACPFREEILSFDDGEPPKMKRQRPEHLDEAMAARLFRDALADEKWADFAKWVREEVSYTSESEPCHYEGKLNFLRYMQFKIDVWKEHPAKLWSQLSCVTGTVLWQGRRRPCTATFQRTKPVAITVFDDDGHGMIGHIHNLPRSEFDTLIQDSDMIQTPE